MSFERAPALAFATLGSSNNNTHGDTDKRAILDAPYSYSGEEDPLGILGGKLEHTNCENNYDGGIDDREQGGLGEVLPPFDVNLSKRDPCGAIDAILQHSREVRDRIFSRQVGGNSSEVLYNVTLPIWCWVSCSAA